MTELTLPKSTTTAMWAQFVAIIIGIGTIVLHMGRKDAQLEATITQVKELTNIVQDLTKSQIALTIRTQQSEAQLEKLAERIDRLERSPR